MRRIPLPRIHRLNLMSLQGFVDLVTRSVHDGAIAVNSPKLPGLARHACLVAEIGPVYTDDAEGTMRIPRKAHDIVAKHLTGAAPKNVGDTEREFGRPEQGGFDAA